MKKFVIFILMFFKISELLSQEVIKIKKKIPHDTINIEFFTKCNKDDLLLLGRCSVVDNINYLKNHYTYDALLDCDSSYNVYSMDFIIIDTMKTRINYFDYLYAMFYEEKIKNEGLREEFINMVDILVFCEIARDSIIYFGDGVVPYEIPLPVLVYYYEKEDDKLVVKEKVEIMSIDELMKYYREKLFARYKKNYGRLIIDEGSPCRH